MNRKPFLGLVALVTIAGGALFLLVRDDGTGRAPAGTTVASHATPEAPRSEPSEISPADSLAAAATSERSERREAKSVAVAVDAAELGNTESFDATSAVWIDVDVVLPAGVPLDDSIALLAFSRFSEDELDLWDFSDALVGVDLSNRFVEESEHAELEWARREVSGPGLIRMPFAKGAGTGALLIQSRYVFSSYVIVDLEDESSATIEGTLGAYVTGRIIVPAGAQDRALGADDFELSFDGRSGGRGFFGGDSGDSRAVHIEPDLSFELRALSADSKYMVHASSESLVDFMELSFKPQAGEHRQLDIELALGAEISGRVVGTDGSPIEGGVVSANARTVALIFRGNNAASGVTADDGTFLLVGVPAGKVTVSATAEGWREAEELSFELANGETLAGIEFKLERGNQVFGRVVWPDGEPAVGARVSASKRERQGWLNTLANQEAGEDGSFTLSGLGEGPFEIVARAVPEGEEPSGSSSSTVRSDAVDADDEAAIEAFLGDVDWENSGVEWRASREGVAANAAGLVLTLEKPLGISGIVIDDVNAPIVGEFTVTARLAGSPIWGADERVQSFENEDGTFTLPGLYPGSWVARVEADAYSGPEEGVTFTIPHVGAPIVIEVDRTVTVRGIVIDPGGRPIEGAEIVASEGAGSQFSFQETTEAMSDADGSFELENCPTDGLTLLASHDLWATSEPLPVVAAPGEHVPDLVLTLRVGATITGEVFNSDGAPDAGVMVSASRGGNFAFFSGEQGQLTDASGRFVLEHVSPGKVTVTAMPTGDDLLETVVGAEDEMAMMNIFGQMRMETVEVADGDEVHVVLGAKPKSPVRVFGRVLRDGEALAEHSVLVIEEGGAILAGMKVAKTDADGNYSITVDRPGSYVFGVGRKTFGGDQSQFFVDVPEAVEYEIDLIIPLGRIAGIVVDSSGAPLSGISVRLSRTAGVMGMADLDQSSTQRTDADGTFAFETLEAGEFAVSAGGSANFFTEERLQFGAVVIDGLELGQDDAIDDVRIELRGAGKLTGIVRDEEGIGVPRASIFVLDADGRVLSNLATCVTNGAGRFSYPGLPVGQVSVLARSSDKSSETIGPIEIDEDRESEIEISVSDGCFLVVTLLDDGEPVRARLRVIDAAGRQVNGLISMDQMEALVTEGFNSKERRVGPLPPGKYTLFATGPDGKDTRKSVTVRAGQSERNVKLRLK